MITQKDLFPRDPNLVHYPLDLYPRPGRAVVHKEDLDALRRHLDPGGGTLFADAACGSPAFDAAFRRFVAELLPNNPLIPIPARRVLHHQARLRPLRRSVHQGSRRRPRFPPARRGPDQRPLGRSSTRSTTSAAPRATHRHRVQGIHLRKRHQDRRQHRDLFHASVMGLGAAIRARGLDERRSGNGPAVASQSAHLDFVFVLSIRVMTSGAVRIGGIHLSLFCRFA